MYAHKHAHVHAHTYASKHICPLTNTYLSVNLDNLGNLVNLDN